MRLLAIDTTAEACSVGIHAGDPPDVLLSEVIGRGHAERLVGMIDAAMSTAGLSYQDLERIVVTVGPGSFTGVRVGIAAARGLALVTGCPAIGVGTLAVHAEAARAMAGAQPILAAARCPPRRSLCPGLRRRRRAAWPAGSRSAVGLRRDSLVERCCLPAPALR